MSLQVDYFFLKALNILMIIILNSRCDDFSTSAIFEDYFEDDFSLQAMFFLAFWHALKAGYVSLSNRDDDK